MSSANSYLNPANDGEGTAGWPFYSNFPKKMKFVTCRLSLIPEQVPSTVEECEEPSESSHVLSMEENTDSPPVRRSRLHSMFSGILRRKSRDMTSPKSDPEPS
ncbi:unnamed protein product [Strongylus vulgaris]|uniref:Uncharacterized protein n=1 Tax=Strongylus vulgaris TaxID=40348 RepID=A0A3P7K2V8_STRVU|nr:unnamed protein product [Strongylus vulgaris]